MPYYCTVPRCTSMAGKAKNVSFHQFPRDEELAKLWNKILKRGKPYTKYSKVCSLHFTAEDYTITSVGKNKGQWRTLRKDAIPSQNLPSESPTPYQRKQWSSWTRDQPSNLMDPTIQQQVAQAIYMQTMLAMQAAGATEMSSLNHTNGFPPVSTEAFAHTSTTPDTDILKGKQTNLHAKSNSFKCIECSKCFKDPDVFILHKRSHEKNEKENFNLNLTLQANPILANLLKTNTENSNIFDNNFSVEILMRALAANMGGYLHNFTSMIKSESMDHDHADPDNENGHLDHDTPNVDHGRGSDHEDDNLERDLSHRGMYDKNNVRNFIQDCQSTSSVFNHNSIQKDRMNRNESARGLIELNDRIVEHYRNNTYDNDRSVRYYENNDSGSQEGNRDVYDHGRGMMDHDTSQTDHNNDNDSTMTHKNKNAHVDTHNMKNFAKRTVAPDRDMTDHGRGMKNQDRGIECNSDLTEHERAMIDNDSAMVDHDRGIIDNDIINYDKCNDDDVTTDDSQGSSVESICDLNESIDSNKLVIDETV